VAVEGRKRHTRSSNVNHSYVMAGLDPQRDSLRSMFGGESPTFPARIDCETHALYLVRLREHIPYLVEITAVATQARSIG
jgi:hypothetical protein